MTIRAIFPGRVLARISILPKISRIWLCLRVQTDRCMTRFLMFRNASRGTLNQSNIEILARTRPGKWHYGHPIIATNNYTFLWSFVVLPVHCLRVIGLPGEEDWPIESPVCYSPTWAEKKPTKQLLPSLGHEENDLLSVSGIYSYMREILVTGTQNKHK